ncbi:LolA family protein [Arenimonas fontis]|uniref:Outer membrane lipoprotein carrier protein LolA n=1 Tax=Arenimonas fontis TaxID=2608255 RepID=A0A5B2Z761_9GAMM|nr:hypothetical protein [Arenimonas fontis]KAA2284608.1 hypothetical protein F0415_07855 [Arenimonas fontis]
MRLRLFACLLLCPFALPVLAGPREELTAAWAKFIQLEAFRAEVRSAGDDRLSARMSFRAPDRFRIEVDNAPGMIIIGNTAYMNMGAGWMSVPVPVADMTRKYRDDSVLEQAAKMQVEALGEDRLDGEPVRKYRYTTPDSPNTRQVAWVSQDSGYVLQIEVDGEGRDDVVIRYRDFNDPGIRIEAPR